VTRLLFWAAGALIGFTYVGFPALVALRARLVPRPHRRDDISPPVSVIIAAHDERPHIGGRVDNLLAQDYPVDRLEIIVASDGSEDGTPEAARRDDPRVIVLDLPRVGKASALNAAVDRSRGEILVFTDANTSYAPNAIRALVRSFADPEVGGVAGDQVYFPSPAVGAAAADAGTDSVGVGERSYWNFDRRIKVYESLVGNVISATGAIYALRRELFRAVPEGVTDDFITSTRVIDQGRRLVFETEAMAFEPVAQSSRMEYRRKVRIMTRGLRGVMFARALLDPRRYGFYAVQLATHKVLRRLMAIPLLVIAATSPLLWGRGALYRLATVGQVGVYGLGALGLLLRERPVGRRRILALPAFFCLVNVAALHALFNLVTGRRIARWVPDRGAAPPVNPADEESPAA
jgi:cellulose synthase/poly-beta-1,6-N-acetylglucosamine synthase-like glycosyltransferase